VPSGITEFRLAMFAEMAVIRSRCAIMPLVEMSSDPYMLLHLLEVERV
jgi:hypothetical protein